MMYESEIDQKSFSLRLNSFMFLKNAVIDGDHVSVAELMQKDDVVTVDPMDEKKYFNEENISFDDLYPAENHDLLYFAVEHPDVLNILLTNDRFHPNQNENDAFYRALYLEKIESLCCFIDHRNFTVPENTLFIAIKTNHLFLVKSLVEMLQNAKKPFSPDVLKAAESYAKKNHQTVIENYIHGLLSQEINFGFFQPGVSGELFNQRNSLKNTNSSRP